jgi:hypothetical protein
MAEHMETVAGDCKLLQSRLRARLTMLDGWGRTNRNVSSLTGVTKGVVSGVASMAVSGGDSRDIRGAAPPGDGSARLPGEVNSQFRLGVHSESLNNFFFNIFIKSAATCASVYFVSCCACAFVCYFVNCCECAFV